VQDVLASLPAMPDGPAEPEPDYGRYLEDAHGVREQRCVAAVPEAALLLRWYRDMRIARGVDQEAIYLQRQGHLGTYASSKGQEAAQVGSASAARSSDWIFPSYREMGAAVSRGLPPEAILHAWRGTWFAVHDPAEHRFGLLTIPLATQALHATGLALASVQDGHDDVVLCYLGDGATSEGDAHEAFNFAAVFQLPVVFVIQNNQYAISVPVARQTRVRSLARKGFAYGMPGYTCDGNDVVAVHGAVGEAVERARQGLGPSIVEAVTYRMEAHTTADDPTRYRDAEEVARWQERDPITRLEVRLERQGLLDAATREHVDDLVATETARVRRTIVETEEVHPRELFEHVLASPSARLARQQQEVLDALDA
jgi:2-oxoisovalerate dehydrogenase E1 component alpha subunit